MTTKNCCEQAQGYEATAEQLIRLAEERERAWRAFDPGKLPGLANDWTRFAQANAAWEALYRRVYGGAGAGDDCSSSNSGGPGPESDWIDRAAGLWWGWYRYERTNAREQPPARLGQAIEALKPSGWE